MLKLLALEAKNRVKKCVQAGFTKRGAAGLVSSVIVVPADKGRTTPAIMTKAISTQSCYAIITKQWRH